MTLQLGALDVVDVRYGSLGATKVMLGTVLVWPTAPGVVTGAVAALEGADTAAIVGTSTAPVAPVTGAVAVTELADTAAVVGSFAAAGSFVGTIGVTEADDLAAIDGTVTAPTFLGTVAVTELDDLAAIVGASTAPLFTGDIVALEADDLATVTGTSTAPIYTGTIGVVEADDTAAIAGTLEFVGVVAVTEATDTSTITGTVEFVGTIAVTEGADTPAIAGTFTAAGGAVFTDDFNRANTGSLGASWQHDAGAWTIVSNQANRTSTGGDFAVFDHDVGSPDMWAEGVPIHAGLAYSLINCRTSPAGRGQNLYAVFFVPSGSTLPSSLVPKIGKIVGGGYSDVATGTAVTVPANPKVRIETQGTAIRFYLNDVLILSGTDSSVTTGNYAGLNHASAGGVDRYVDNFRCGALPWSP